MDFGVKDSVLIEASFAGKSLKRIILLLIANYGSQF